jgi:hypothetical protein
MLFSGQNEARGAAVDERGRISVDSIDGHAFRDRWGYIHPATSTVRLRSGQAAALATGHRILLPIFTDAIGDDMEHTRQTLFDSGNLFRPYHSVNTDINKRIRFLEDCSWRGRDSEGLLFSPDLGGSASDPPKPIGASLWLGGARDPARFMQRRVAARKLHLD